MAEARLPDPSLLVIACFSRHREALDWAGQKLQNGYGPISLVSQDFDFQHTKYYEGEMGSGQHKRFLVFERLVPSEILPEVKIRTNILEKEIGDLQLYSEPRPLNLDPGLLQLGKFLLATTKDQSHRIYLREGIYAEVTLRFTDGAFEPWPWTYADYREPACRAFLKQARDFLKIQLENFRHNQG